MAVKCAICEKYISKNSDYLNCRKRCNSNYHLNCLHIGEEAFVRMRDSGELRSWDCGRCSDELTCKTRKTSVSSTPGNAQSSAGEDLLETLVAKKVSEMLDGLRRSVFDSLRDEVHRMHINNSNFSEEVSNFKKEISKLVTENDKLKLEVRRLKQQLEASTIDGPLPTKCSDVDISNIAPDTQNKLRSKNFTDKNVTYASKNANSDKKKNVNTSNSKSDKNTYAEALSNVGFLTDPITKSSTIVENKSKKSAMIDITDDTNDFQLVRRQRKSNSKGNTITGTAPSSNLKAITKYNYVYVTRLDKTTSVEDIVGYLKEKNFLNVICDKMSSKKPDVYSSFRVGVPFNEINKLKEPEVWPMGAYVNTFFWKMKPHQISP